MALLEQDNRFLIAEIKGVKGIDPVNLYDKQGKVIGKIIYSGLKKISVLDTNEKEVFSIAGTGSFKIGYELRDLNVDTKAVFKLKKSGPLDKRKIVMKYDNDSKNLTGRITGTLGIQITDESKKIVANYSRLRESFMPKISNLDFQNSFGFELLDSSFDKIFLVGFFVVLVSEITDSFFEDKWSEG